MDPEQNKTHMHLFYFVWNNKSKVGGKEVSKVDADVGYEIHSCFHRQISAQVQESEYQLSSDCNAIDLQRLATFTLTDQ